MNAPPLDVAFGLAVVAAETVLVAWGMLTDSRKKNQDLKDRNDRRNRAATDRRG